jgi:excisionase family DNA binding protein
MKAPAQFTQAANNALADHQATTKDVAEFIGVSKRTAQNLYYRKVIPGIKVGRLLRFKLKDVEKALSRYTREEIK